MPRRKATTPKGGKPPSTKIGEALRISGIPTRQESARTARINMRVTPEAKEEVAAIAHQLGLSLTDYLLELHNQAKAILLDHEIP